jgi:arsenate reductase
MLNTSDKEITLFYDASSRDGTQTLAYAKGKGIAVNDIDIRGDKVTGTELLTLARKLKTDLKELINTEHPDFKDNYNGFPEDEEDVIKMIKSHPEIMNVPIAIRGDKAIIINTPTDILKL